jgi:hypothetical protein
MNRSALRQIAAPNRDLASRKAKTTPIALAMRLEQRRLMRQSERGEIRSFAETSGLRGNFFREQLVPTKRI